MAHRFTLDGLYGEDGRREGCPGDQYEVKPGQFAVLKAPTVALHREARQVMERYRDDPERMVVEVGRIVLEASFEVDESCRLDMLSKAVADFFTLSMRTARWLLGG